MRKQDQGNLPQNAVKRLTHGCNEMEGLTGSRWHLLVHKHKVWHSFVRKDRLSVMRYACSPTDKWVNRTLKEEDSATAWIAAYRLLGAPWCNRKYLCPGGHKMIAKKDGKKAAFSNTNQSHVQPCVEPIPLKQTRI